MSDDTFSLNQMKVIKGMIDDAVWNLERIMVERVAKTIYANNAKQAEQLRNVGCKLFSQE